MERSLRWLLLCLEVHDPARTPEYAHTFGYIEHMRSGNLNARTNKLVSCGSQEQLPWVVVTPISVGWATLRVATKIPAPFAKVQASAIC